MNEFCLALLTNLLRTTAYLAATAILVGVLLKISRCQSPRVHRVAWCLVLLQGLLFVRIPWSIAWLPRPGPVANRTENLPRLDEPTILPIDPLVKFSVSPNEEAISVSPRPVAPEQPSQPSVIAGLRNHWPILAALFWLGGVVTVAGVWIFRYVRFLQTVPAGEQGESQWQQEFAAVLGETNHARAIDLRITNDAGPLICRRSGSYALLVPRPLWQSLSAAQRQAILRHEIGHYRRGDLWKSIAIRVLALPHWFNPFTWLAVRRFDEAAEWACDELAAAGVSATEFASVLLKLCESTKLHPTVAPAATGSGVSQRIRRLVSVTTKEDSIMRKIIVCSAATLLLLTGALQVRLVAKDAQPQPLSVNPQAETDTPNARNVNYAKEMVEAAERTFEATQAAYNAGTVPMEPVYTWSRKWMQALLDTAVTPGERLAAYRAHRDRMQQLYDEVHTKFLLGANGGEADRNYSAQFYLAEANLWLEQESGKGGTTGEAARVEVYPITVADPETVTKVLQTVLAGIPGVRLTVDTKSNYLIAMAPPKEQALIQELVNKLNRKPEAVAKSVPDAESQKVEVVYPVKSPEAMHRLLQSLVPNLEIRESKSSSSIIVTAPKSQQEGVRRFLEGIITENPPATNSSERH